MTTVSISSVRTSGLQYLAESTMAISSQWYLTPRRMGYTETNPVNYRSLYHDDTNILNQYYYLNKIPVTYNIEKINDVIYIAFNGINITTEGAGLGSEPLVTDGAIIYAQSSTGCMHIIFFIYFANEITIPRYASYFIKPTVKLSSTIIP